MKIFDIDKISSKEELGNGMEGAVYKIVLNGEVYAYKSFFQTESMYFANKLFVISALYASRKIIDIPALLLPLGLGTEENNIKGMVTRYIDGPTLEKVLADETIDIHIKVKYLKQIGAILKQMKKLREKTELHDFYINDLHKSNFIIDSKNDMLYVGDLDACHIAGNHFAASKQLFLSDLVLFPEKYKREDSQKRKIIASEETDLFCYAMLVMTFLMDRSVILTREKYMECLNFLESAGVHKDLLSALAKVYSNEPNINIRYLLGYIPESYERVRTKREFFNCPHND